MASMVFFWLALGCLAMAVLNVQMKRLNFFAAGMLSFLLSIYMALPGT